MPPRPVPAWTVLASYQTLGADRCVDVFRRVDATFGFEEYRRDPEDQAGWFPVGSYAGREYPTEDAALSAARRVVGWLADALEP
ncbi:MAG: hypothetical protein KGJ36_01730 [Acidobacteriota bacterium]|nr:hypothetical protein [Acidobacteriota bacterium]